MHAMKIFALCVALATASPKAAAVHKCKGAGGKVTYQAEPCAGDSGQRVEIVDSGASGGPPRAANPQLNLALLRGEPYVGMSEIDLRKVMGAPDRVNTAQYGTQGQTSNQLIYERPTRTWYVQTDAGVVSSVQSQQRSAPPEPAQAQAQKWCPSGLAIRNMETSASSRTISEIERVERLREIRRIRERCG